MGIADLGCSSGPNTLTVISEIIDVIYSKCSNLGCPTPELRICLNDLYSNDFNDVFGSLPAFYNKLKEEKGTDFGQCFITGVPGSFSVFCSPNVAKMAKEQLNPNNLVSRLLLEVNR